MPALHARDECGRAMMICARLPDLFQLLQSDFRQCSLERLLRLLTTPGCDVGIVIGSPVRSPAGLGVSSPAKLAKRSVRRRSRRSPSTAGTVPHPPTKGCRSVLGPLAQPVDAHEIDASTARPTLKPCTENSALLQVITLTVLTTRGQLLVRSRGSGQATPYDANHGQKCDFLAIFQCFTRHPLVPIHV